MIALFKSKKSKYASHSTDELRIAVKKKIKRRLPEVRESAQEILKNEQSWIMNKDSASEILEYIDVVCDPIREYEKMKMEVHSYSRKELIHILENTI